MQGPLAVKSKAAKPTADPQERAPEQGLIAALQSLLHTPPMPASVKSVGSTPVQCVDHLVPLCSGTFSFSVLGVGAEQGSSSLECVCFDRLSRTKWNVARSGQEHV